MELSCDPPTTAPHTRNDTTRERRWGRRRPGPPSDATPRRARPVWQPERLAGRHAALIRRHGEVVSGTEKVQLLVKLRLAGKGHGGQRRGGAEAYADLQTPA